MAGSRKIASSPTDAGLQSAQANWTGDFIDGHLGVAYEVKLFGPYYARPEVSLDYLRCTRTAIRRTGAGASFNLAVAPQDDTQFSGQGLMVLGRQWGRTSWFRTELRLGYREVIERPGGRDPPPLSRTEPPSPSPATRTRAAGRRSASR